MAMAMVTTPGFGTESADAPDAVPKTETAAKLAKTAMVNPIRADRSRKPTLIGDELSMC
jgi:hypothetical protein